MSGIHGSAVFSDDGMFRHRLDRWWSDEPRALVCMANPSNAGADINDPTIHSLIRLLRPLPGVGGFTVVNWQPRIATNPKDLFTWRDSVAMETLRGIQQANLELIGSLTTNAAIRVLAWGDIVPLVPYTSRVKVALSCERAYPLLCFGTTKSGNPKHPLARGKSFIATGTLPSVFQSGLSQAA